MTEKAIAEQHAALRVACDPGSPFFGKIDFQDGLLSLPVSDQHRIYDTMPPDLRGMVEGFQDALKARRAAEGGV